MVEGRDFGSLGCGRTPAFTRDPGFSDLTGRKMFFACSKEVGLLPLWRPCLRLYYTHTQQCRWVLIQPRTRTLTDRAPLTQGLAYRQCVCGGNRLETNTLSLLVKSTEIPFSSASLLLVRPRFSLRPLTTRSDVPKAPPVARRAGLKVNHRRSARASPFPGVPWVRKAEVAGIDPLTGPGLVFLRSPPRHAGEGSLLPLPPSMETSSASALCCSGPSRWGNG